MVLQQIKLLDGIMNYKKFKKTYNNDFDETNCISYKILSTYIEYTYSMFINKVKL